MNDGMKRVIRTVLQLVAGGALAALTDQLVTDVSAQYAPYLTIGYTLLVTIAQNALEDMGAVKPILKPDIGQIKDAAYVEGLHDASGERPNAKPRVV